MVTIKLDGIEAAALDIVAKHLGVTPDHLIRDLIRDAAIVLVTGKPSRIPEDVKILKAEAPKPIPPQDTQTQITKDDRHEPA